MIQVVGLTRFDIDYVLMPKGPIQKDQREKDSTANTQHKRRDDRAPEPCRDADDAQVLLVRIWTLFHARLRFHPTGEDTTSDQIRLIP